MSWLTDDAQFKITPGVTKLVVEKWEPRNRAWMPNGCFTLAELAEEWDLASLIEIPATREAAGELAAEILGERQAA